MVSLLLDPNLSLRGLLELLEETAFADDDAEEASSLGPGVMGTHAEWVFNTLLDEDDLKPWSRRCTRRVASEPAENGRLMDGEDLHVESEEHGNAVSASLDGAGYRV